MSASRIVAAVRLLCYYFLSVDVRHRGTKAAEMNNHLIAHHTMYNIRRQPKQKKMQQILNERK